MDQPRRILIADRSELAANVYRFLLGPLGATLLLHRRIEEVKSRLLRRERADLAIMSSNTFGTRFPKVLQLLQDKPLRDIPKIILCRDVAAEAAWRESLEAIPGAALSARPFHPEEFFDQVRSALFPASAGARAEPRAYPAPTAPPRVATPERRVHPRRACCTNVVFEDEFGEPLFFILSEDISLGGMFLASEIPLRIGAMLFLAFALPPHKRPIRVTGEVIRRAEEDGERARGMGVRFVGLSGKARRRIEEFVKRKETRD